MSLDEVRGEDRPMDPRGIEIPRSVETSVTEDGRLLIVWGHRDVLDANPWLKSKTALREGGLMPGAGPVASYVRHRRRHGGWVETGRIDLFDERDAVPYSMSDEERELAARKRADLRARKTCPLCGRVVRRLDMLHGHTEWVPRFGRVEIAPNRVRIEGDDGAMREVDVCDDCLERLRAKTTVPPAPETVPDTIVLDTETTGLSPAEDELLSVGIVGDDGSELWSSRVRPVRTVSWPEAEDVNGIGYADVSLAPTAGEIAPVVQSIVDRCDEVVGYNVGFDAGFLEHAGVDLSRVRVTDVMEPFAEVYGEEDDYHGGCRWQRLTTAAAYYHYDWSRGPGAHDALADAAATAWVWSHMRGGGD